MVINIDGWEIAAAGLFATLVVSILSAWEVKAFKSRMQKAFASTSNKLWSDGYVAGGIDMATGKFQLSKDIIEVIKKQEEFTDTKKEPEVQ